MHESLAVIIIGAGLSGLTLAQSLSKRNISCRVYESDPSLHARTQGYRVRISDEGIKALEESLTVAAYAKVKSSCGLSTGESNLPLAILDGATADIGGPLFQPGTKAPIAHKSLRKPLSADRSVLRRNLLDGIEDRVVFGEKFDFFDEVEEGIVAHFESGMSVKGLILVGADGTWSRVRQNLLPSFTLLDTEARLVFGKTEFDESLARDFSPLALQGLTFIHGDGLNCLLEPMHFNKDRNDLPADYVYWVIFLRSDSENTPTNILDMTSNEIADLTRQLTSQWHSSLRSLFDDSRVVQRSVLRILSVKPEISDWGQESGLSKRVTLIGDAAHAMSPTAALGATTALRDANTLSISLEGHGLGSEALRAYECEMREYASEALNNSLIGGRTVFGMRPFEDLPEIHVRASSQG